MMCDELGYRRFAIQAIDMGVGVTTEMALSIRFCDGLHLSGANHWLGEFPQDMSEAEKEFITKTNMKFFE